MTEQDKVRQALLVYTMIRQSEARNETIKQLIELEKERVRAVEEREKAREEREHQMHELSILCLAF